MTRQMRIGSIPALLVRVVFVCALMGCSLPETLRPTPLPRDSAAVFHAFVPGEPFVPFESLDAPWLTLAEPPSSVTADTSALRLASVPGRRVWASPRLPVAALGSVSPHQVEELIGEAAVSIEQRYFIVCELRFAGEPGAVLFQATPFDVQVSHDRDRPGGATSQSVSRLIGDGKPHVWRFRIDATRTELRLDGSTAWTLDGPHALARVAFGETRTDAEHGGSMALRDLVYVRRPA